jgi:hypothetical protein
MWSISLCSAATAKVPDSFAPGELLLQFGTGAQRNYRLPIAGGIEP